MSISPSQHLETTNPSSHQAPYQNPNSSNHGVLQSSSTATNNPSIRWLRISDSDSITNPSKPSSSSTSPVAANSGGHSKKVSNGSTTYARRSSYHHHRGSYSQRQPAARGQGGISSEFRNERVGSSQRTGELSGDASSQQQTISGRVSNSAVRKNISGNANHLLNFHYDRVSHIYRPQPRAPPPRRQHKIKPYNKDLFLQANYKFVVLDSGNDAVESTDPDKMIDWEDVICVRYSTPFPVQCPICLEHPLCPQITSCGHIFCFPCILQYLLMGEEDHKGDCWKKCPLCFMMISSKELYTIYIENVRHYHVGDTLEFTLLTRQKNSLFPSQKNQPGVDSIAGGSVDQCDTFSKFILTSDIDLSVGEAYSELKDWLVRADSGLVDNLEQLPYVCAAVEQLEQRKKFWTEIQSLSCSPTLRNPTTPGSNIKGCTYSSGTDTHPFSSYMNGVVDSEVDEDTYATPSREREHITQTGNVPATIEGEAKLLSSYGEGKISPTLPNGSDQIKENDAYSFYQAVDGQHIILHPLNMKCLLHYYGNYDSLPPRINGEILHLEMVTQSEAMRRRYRQLSHFSLTTTFQLCEIDMSRTLPLDAMTPFLDEIKKRENQRRRLAHKEHQDKVKAEAAAIHAMAVTSSFGSSSFVDTTFSMDDFEALATSPVPSTSPPTSGERKLFSDVTRLGFAAAHDSPSLKVDDSSDVSSNREERAETSGSRNMTTLSFANIISTVKSPESVEIPKMNGFAGKKGKKPTRVLLSTAGGRRY